MEWDSRTCAWNGISKLEVEDNSYNHHLAATLACSSGSGLTNMFSVDLNLGRLEDMPDLSMETFNNSVPTNMGPTPPPTSPVMALSKRGEGHATTVLRLLFFVQSMGARLTLIVAGIIIVAIGSARDILRPLLFLLLVRSSAFANNVAGKKSILPPVFNTCIVWLIKLSLNYHT